MKDKIVIYKSRKKASTIILLSLLLAVAGWLFLRYADKDIIGWSILILAGLCLILGIGNWSDRKPYLVLTPDGITELSGAGEEVEWNAILRVDEFFFRGHYFIRLLTDRNYKPDFIHPTWFNRFDRLYEREGVKAIYIRTGFLEVNSIKLARFIRKMMKADAAQRMNLLHKPLASW